MMIIDSIYLAEAYCTINLFFNLELNSPKKRSNLCFTARAKYHSQGMTQKCQKSTQNHLYVKRGGENLN